MQNPLQSLLDPQLTWQLMDISLVSLESSQLLGAASWHPQRKLAHTASLICLGTLAQIPAQLLEEQHYYKIKERPLLCSRSHTQNFTAACTLNTESGSTVLSVGIDLEPKDRPLKEDISKFYLHPDDQAASPLENWCAKEAAFKALSSYLLFHQIPLGKTLTLKDFIVQGDLFYLDPSLEIKAQGRLEWHKQDGHLVCLAVLDKLQRSL